MTRMIYILYKPTSRPIIDVVTRQSASAKAEYRLCLLFLFFSHPPLPIPSSLILSFVLHATGKSLPALSLALHLLADLDVDLEELRYAAVEADGLALVQVGFAVRCVDAFR